MSKDLLSAMENVRRFLESYEVPVWPSRLLYLEEDVKKLRPDNTVGWQHFLKNALLFGGTGALDDMFICQANGHRVDDEKQANSQYKALLAELRRTFREYRLKYGIEYSPDRP